MRNHITHFTMMKILLLLLVTSLNIFESSARSCLITYEVRIQILNEIEDSQPLTIHCWSKDDNLGYHTLKYISYYEWSFCEQAFKGSRFFCDFWWGSKHKFFDAFRSEKHGPSDWQHYWFARKDGIYHSSFNKPAQNGTPIKFYDWE
ncbi:hypothetical protein CASFOL_042458 [Castilleja foliolosa]|uniref:S-protein homolog n=1 Tax=Castilleja foliolosa TaxID=1961234 RepID=A0ABD3BAU6_9LAMI